LAYLHDQLVESSQPGVAVIQHHPRARCILLLLLLRRQHLPLRP
jgi:hypothetical protein